MALGYGSEFHLLRWLGRHRNEFDKRLKLLLGIDNISWLDFNFDSEKTIPDKEIIGLKFLDENVYESVISTWKKEWPQTGNSMNWDLVGFTENQGEKTYILIEAKAHLGELEQNCGASPENLTKIEKALAESAKRNGITIIDKNPWTKKYYQLANRIYILDLLKRHNIKAILVNIYFIGDMCSKNRNSPQNRRDWQTKVDDMKKYLNIEKLTTLEIRDLFLEIDK
ncbi:MAG TPA: hypothetical protein PKE03_03940 [Bacteroidales bacterium]|nr:hypothetical protein [Bacteroidales bacterium]